MRKMLMAALMVAGMGMFFTPSVAAVPPTGAIAVDPVANQVSEPAAAQEARLYCHRGSVFLHWGPCAQDRWRYGYRPTRYYRPAYRVYRPVYRRVYYRRY